MPLPTDADLDEWMNAQESRLVGNRPVKLVVPPGTVTTLGSGITAVDQRVYLGTLNVNQGGTGHSTASSAKENLAVKPNAVFLRFAKYSQAREACEDYGLDMHKDITRDPPHPEEGRRHVYQVEVPLKRYNASISPENRTKEWLEYAAILKNRKLQIKKDGGFWVPAYLSTTGQKEWLNYDWRELEDPDVISK